MIVLNFAQYFIRNTLLNVFIKIRCLGKFRPIMCLVSMQLCCCFCLGHKDLLSSKRRPFVLKILIYVFLLEKIKKKVYSWCADVYWCVYLWVDKHYQFLPHEMHENREGISFYAGDNSWWSIHEALIQELGCRTWTLMIAFSFLITNFRVPI